MNWIADNLWFISSLAALAFGVWWLMPTRHRRPRAVGLTLAIAGLFGQGLLLEVPAPLAEDLLFYIFGGGAVLSAILMITSRYPVYGALWFALVTLCTCCLFLLQNAPFLAAATIIVYAGAIIVTFVFVIMLAQQEGTAVYDQRSRRPIVATIAAFVLLGGLLTTLNRTSFDLEPAPVPVTADGAVANPFSHPADSETVGSMHSLGRSLFGDYLYAVELAGTLLLVAAIGAIAIAPRRVQGAF